MLREGTLTLPLHSGQLLEGFMSECLAGTKKHPKKGAKTYIEMKKAVIRPP